MKNEETTQESRTSTVIQTVALILLAGLIMWSYVSSDQYSYCKSIGDTWNCGAPFK